MQDKACTCNADEYRDDTSALLQIMAGDTLSQRTHLLRVGAGQTTPNVIPSLPRDWVFGYVVGASLVGDVAVGPSAAT